MEYVDYVLLNNTIRPCVRYIADEEGKPANEELWVDEQNCMYYTFIDENAHYDEKTRLVDGKKYWIISPFKPRGTKVTEENQWDLIKWFVTDCTDEDDLNKMWDRDKCVPLDIKTKGWS